MFYNVDFMGIEAVSKMITQSNLKKFIIFRQGSPKGSTPVYDCSFTNSNAGALKNFKDWSSNIVQFNPTNNLAYDILLFNNEGDQADDEKEGKRINKIRFSFMLQPGSERSENRSMAPQIDIAGEIEKGIRMALLEQENQRLKRELEEIELEEEEEDDEPDQEDAIGKVINLISEINKSNQGVKIAGDDSLDQNLTDQKKSGLSDQERARINQSIKKSIQILWSKNKQLDKDLEKLADLSQKNGFLFEMILQKLRSM